jgi:hypothetical protein
VDKANPAPAQTIIAKSDSSKALTIQPRSIISSSVNTSSKYEGQAKNSDAQISNKNSGNASQNNSAGSKASGSTIGK